MFLKKTLLLILTPVIQVITAADSPDLPPKQHIQFSQAALMVGVIDGLISGGFKPLDKVDMIRCFVEGKRTAIDLKKIQSLLQDAQKEIDPIVQNAQKLEQIEYLFFTTFPIKKEAKDSEECKKHFALFELYTFVLQSKSPELRNLYKGLIDNKPFSEIVALHKCIQPLKINPIEQRYTVFAERYWNEFAHIRPLAILPPINEVSSTFPCCNTL